METRKPTIYIVEDDDIFGNTVFFALKAHGYRTSLFSNGEQLMEQLQHQPDLIILDYNLDTPKDKKAWNGGSILMFLKQHHPKVPVIILSGNSQVDLAVSLLKMGAVDYIQKDKYFFDRLLKTVANILKIKKYRSELTELKKQNTKYKKRLLIYGLVSIASVIGLFLAH